MILFDFQCPSCGHKFERMVKQEVHATPCPKCSHDSAERQISPVRISYTRMVTDGRASSDGLTTSIDRWDRARRQKMKIEQQKLADHGTYD